MTGQSFYKRVYGIKDFYSILEEAVNSFTILRKARKKNILSKQFEERIMLAVTEVNGCEMCSYYHTKEALKSGMSEKDIQNMLQGESGEIPEEESIAIFFAQHYAESLANPDAEAWQRVVEFYGEEKAEMILAYIKVIMMGNVYGLAAGSFLNRFKGVQVNKRSSIGLELSILLSVIIFFPVLFIKKQLRTLSL
jgi:AhpD family alkylhydroperoxidase